MATTPAATPKPTPPRTHQAEKPARATQRLRRPTHHRGDVWMVVSDPENPSVGNELWSDRPALVISSDVFNRRAGYAVIVYLTTSIKKMRSGPTNVELPERIGTNGKPIANKSVALCGQIHTVDSARLTRRIGHYEAADLLEVEAAVSLALSLTKQGAAPASALFSKWEKQLDEHGIDIAREIEALAVKTTDERVEALTRAVRILATERDAWRDLYSTSTQVAPQELDIEKFLADAASTNSSSTSTASSPENES